MPRSPLPGDVLGSPPESPLDDPALRQNDKAFDLAIRAIEDGNPDPAGYVGGALGLVTGISAIDKREFTQGLFWLTAFRRSGRASRS
jgi:hypothetical protein